MKIEEARSSFTVFVIGTQEERLKEVSGALGAAGYLVAEFNQLTAAFSEFPSNPPHFVVFDFLEDKFNLVQAIEQIQAQLPESHVFVVSRLEDRPRSSILLERGVYDLIYLPAIRTQEIVVRFDHAAERDYFMYLNERLMDGQGAMGHQTLATEPNLEDSGETSRFLLDVQQEHSQNQPVATMPDDFTSLFMQELFQLKSADECIQLFIESISGSYGGVKAAYFKYFGNRRTLVAAMGHNLKGMDLQGLGVDFNQVSTNFRTSQLREPELIPEIKSLAEEVFECKTFQALPIEALGDLQGVAMFFDANPSGLHSSVVQVCHQLLERVLSLFEAQKRLHSVSVKDSSTEVFNRSHFLARSIEEVARARRTILPVSMILLTLDQFGQVLSTYGNDEGNTVLRMIVKIIEKHSRVNDIIGRIGSDEFGILLPHTNLKGALIKAERLRRIVESADFKKVLGTLPTLTVSVGVSEYPSLCRDADELLQTADEALYHVREEQNKVCIAKAPEGFVADFQVNERGYQ